MLNVGVDILNVYMYYVLNKITIHKIYNFTIVGISYGEVTSYMIHWWLELKNN